MADPGMQRLVLQCVSHALTWVQQQVDKKVAEFEESREHSNEKSEGGESSGESVEKKEEEPEASDEGGASSSAAAAAPKEKKPSEPLSPEAEVLVFSVFFDIFPALFVVLTVTTWATATQGGAPL